jgi:hypothetical protein
MTTYPTVNFLAHMNLRRPTTQTRNMPVPIITNYALILLYVYQDAAPQGYKKRELVGRSLGHIDEKYVLWDWSPAAFSEEFAVFNHNHLLRYDRKMWRWLMGPNLKTYLTYHFGGTGRITLDLNDAPYAQAVEYNAQAVMVCDRSHELYRLTKQIGQEYFFQD